MTSRYQIIISENIFYVMQKGREERTMGCDGLMQKVSCHIGGPGLRDSGAREWCVMSVKVLFVRGETAFPVKTEMSRT